MQAQYCPNFGVFKRNQKLQNLREVLIFKCWQLIKIIFKYRVNQMKNGLIGIPFLPHHSVLQFLEFWGPDGAEWTVPYF